MERDSTYDPPPRSLYDPAFIPSAGTCRFCNSIRRVLVNSEWEIDLNPDEIRQDPPCAAHDGLLSWVENTFKEHSRHLDTQVLRNRPDGDHYLVGFVRHKGLLPGIRIRESDGYYRWHRTLSLIGVPEESISNRLETSFNPDWVDLKVAWEWIIYCVHGHGPRCNDILGLSRCIPAYLIDTVQDCIVKGQTGVEYVALSYRWSSVRVSFRTKKSNFASSTVPGGISKQANIPHTIKHAMHVVRAIGERYLWVDSLCIISDDREHFQEQLEIMGSIYSCAKLTIVSADGDAWDGLHGIEDVSQPRQLPNVFPWLGGTKLVVQDVPAVSASQSRFLPGPTSEYFQRGWTFQEYVLSRRRLIFGNRQIHWKCACDTSHENGLYDGSPRYESDRRLSGMDIPNILAGIPDYQELEKVANEYNMRVFTHPEDALPGITGLLNVVKNSFKGGFLCGLPLMRFDAALMWYSGLRANAVSDVGYGYSAGTLLEARKHSAEQNSDLPGAILPSWSWVSWRGKNLRILDGEDSYQLPHRLDDVLYPPKERYITATITTWYSQDTPFSHEKWRIYSFSDSDKNSCDPRLFDQGWIEEPFDLVKHYRDDKVPSYESPEKLEALAEKLVYRHPDLPDKFFWRPFSRSTSEQHEEDAEACQLEQRQYISCQTWRNWFHARRMTRETKVGGPREAAPRHIREVSFDAQIVVVDDSDQVCGWLQVPGEPSLDEFQDGSSELVEIGSINVAFEDAGSCNDKPLPRSKVELVAICCRKKSTVNSADEGETQFYGVLLVEWKDKVAYRRGVGFIEKCMWDQSGPEEVDLVLG